MPATASPLRLRPWSNQRGSSLIETVVAFGLFAMIAATMSQFLGQQVRRASSNHLNGIAIALAEDALEDARAQNVADLTSTEATHEEGGVTFTVSTAVVDDSPAAGLKTVTVEVAWSDQLGPQHVSVPAIYTEVRRF